MGAAAQDVGVGVFGAGALGVVLELEVAHVVQEHGDERELSLAPGNPGGVAGAEPTTKQAAHAQGGLQGVLVIVVVEIEFPVVRMLAGKAVLHFGKHLIEEGRVPVGLDLAQHRLDARRYSGVVSGVDIGEHQVKEEAVNRR